MWLSFAYTMKNLIREKKRNRQYLVETITDLALLANSPAQTESLLQSLEQAARGIGLHVNIYKT